MKYIILFFTLSVHFACRADLGTCYCVKAEVEFADGFYDVSYFKIEGYDFSVEKKGDHYAYSTRESLQKGGWVNLPLVNKSQFDYELYYDSSLSNSLLGLMGDSLKYYTDYIKFNYTEGINETQEIELVGKQFVIGKKEIKKLFIQRLMSCGVGISVLTELKSSDKKWINDVQQVVHLGGLEMCEYSSLHFNIPTKETIGLEQKFKEILLEYEELMIARDGGNRNKKRELKEKINTEIEFLKKQQVVILMSCSC